MPELPEVETTARYLRDRLGGERISSVTVRWERTIALPSVPNFRRSLAGRVVTDVGRRGKFVVISLDHSDGRTFLLGHMRMSGSFDVLSAGLPTSTHDRVQIGFASGREMRFHDPRKFGRLYLTPDLTQVTSHLGVEPLEPAFSADKLAEIVGVRGGAIKPLLLNQSYVAGLGNIYVDEALWRSGIHPLRPASSLKHEELVRLHQAITAVLSEAIEKAGTDFGDGVVDEGGYTPEVYGRDGQQCARCKGMIKRIVVGQRGTHVCARCQRYRRSKKGKSSRE